MRELLAQHTAERGQGFEAGAVERIWALTCGQPWVVNALACEACFRAEHGPDRSRAIGVDAIDEAREALILRRVTHLDQRARWRAGRRQHARRRAGATRDPAHAGRVYGLGLLDPRSRVRPRSWAGGFRGRERIANPIYAEVVSRELTLVLQSGLETQVDPAWYVDADGSLDVAGLLSAFQGYFREHSESWVERYAHAEAGPQLVLHAYLQRVVKGSGRIERE